MSCGAPACGALCPTSESGAALLSPSYFAFYVFYFGGGRGLLDCQTPAAI
jgi:hypothetical protein